jgi:hypothetical protein
VEEKEAMGEEEKESEEDEEMEMEMEEKIEEEEMEMEEEVQYTQVLADQRASLASGAAPDPALLLNENCSTEIREIVRSKCLDRPGLDVCNFPIVWNSFWGFDWYYSYGKGLGSTEVYRRPRTAIKKRA